MFFFHLFFIHPFKGFFLFVFYSSTQSFIRWDLYKNKLRTTYTLISTGIISLIFMCIYITFQAKSYLPASRNIFRTNCTSHDTNIPTSHAPWSCAIMTLTLVSSRTADSPDVVGNDPSSLLKKGATMLPPWQLLYLTAWLQNVSWWCLYSRVHMLVVRGPTLAALPERLAQELARCYCSM